MEPLVNKVANSPIVTLDLAALWDSRSVFEVDIAEFLDGGFVLREKSFREKVKAHDWSHCKDTHVGLICSSDAIIPTWAYMFLSSQLRAFAHSVVVGGADKVREQRYIAILEAHDWEEYRDKPVVVKGCSNDVVPATAYAVAEAKLEKVAKKVMYGEPCSTVPIWRR